MKTTIELTNSHIAQLVNLLLECSSMQDRRLRDDVLAFLPDNVCRAIPRREQDRADVVNIVRVCNKYEEAIAALIEGVRCFDNDNRPMKALDTFWQDLVRATSACSPQPTRLPLSRSRIEDAICNTDFEQASRIFQNIMSSFGHAGGAALFLLEQSYSMGADYVVKLMHHLLSREGLLPDAPVSIGSMSQNGQLANENEVLHKIAAHFNILPSSADVQQGIQEIIAKICASLHTGRVIIFEVAGWDGFQASMLPWFVQDFWIPLLDRLQKTIVDNDLRMVRLIVVMKARQTVERESLAALMCCETDAFMKDKIHPLPLENWSLDDICTCITRFSRLPGREIDNEARMIYEESKCGFPGLVAERLLSQFA